MKPRVVFGIISAMWVLAIVLYVHHLLNSNGFSKVAKIGTCLSTNSNLSLTVISVALPTFSASLLTVILNIYLTIKAYQVHRQIEKESKLLGNHSRDNDQLKTLRMKQAKIKKHLKPMITLLVVVLGTSSFGLLFPLLYVPTVFLESPTVYEKVLRHVLAPNISYVAFLLHPLVYGLYFK